MCEAGLPVACMPLWHDAQLPAMTPLWVNLVPAKLTVVWQTVHGCVADICDDAMVTVLMRAPLPWQLSQVFGVPLKIPRTWQLSQRVDSCAPVSGKPVDRCCAAAVGDRDADCAAATPEPASSTAAISIAVATAATREFGERRRKEEMKFTVALHWQRRHPGTTAESRPSRPGV